MSRMHFSKVPKLFTSYKRENVIQRKANMVNSLYTKAIFYYSF